LKAKPVTADETFDNFDDFVFVRLKPGASRQKLIKHLQLISKRDVQPIFNKTGAKDYRAEFKIEALADVHFSKGKLGDTPKGNRNIVVMFSGLAIFILIVALLNYVNLATARSVSRAREVGVRKVIGAEKWQLIGQFLIESACLVAIAWLIAITIVAFSIHPLEQILNAKLSVEYASFIFLNIAIIIGSVLLAGLYPAFVLSGFQPSTVLKGKFTTSASGNLMKKIVTSAQFAIAFAMIFCTIVIYRQMNYITKLDLGFNAEQLVSINLPNDTTLRPSIAALKSELLKRPGIDKVSLNSGFAEDGRVIGSTLAKINGRQREVMAYYFSVDESFIDVYGMKLKEGRNFPAAIHTDQQ
ncbi:MAG: FtsX-like permease family protein, partial [Chitinophagaceae bacterium]